MLSPFNPRLCGAGRVAEKRGKEIKEETRKGKKKTKNKKGVLGLGVWVAGKLNPRMD